MAYLPVSRPARLLAGVGLSITALVLASGVCSAAAATATTSPRAQPTTVTTAPYLELSAPNAGNLDGGIAAGLDTVTAAFVVGQGCTPVWDDGVPVQKDRKKAKALKRAQRAGAEIIVSFGGAGGKELARSCPKLATLVSAYEDVITKLGVTQLDFDIEGESLDPKAEKASIARRFAAIRQLESDVPGLVVSVTIPVGPDGLERSGIAFLKVAEKSDTRVDLVNVMTMDYGGPVGDMGGTAIEAAAATLKQVAAIWPDDTYANLGITPMIGDNDSADETFTLSDAAEVAAFAASNGVGRVAFWSLNRDQQCHGVARARNDCSGVTQDPLEFTTTFLAG